MLALTAAQLDAWIAALMLPLARLLGLFAAAPLFSNRMISTRVRLAAGLAAALAILPALPPMPPLPTDSWLALGLLAHQMVIGIAIGFTMRLFFASIDLAAEMVGLQMGLSFAVFFSPQTGGQSSVVAEFMVLLTLLIFLALDGHLMLIQVLVASFEWLPVGQATNAGGWLLIGRYAAVVYASAVLLALPLVAVLLITNIALGILTRSAPQLNIFAVGFPVTLSVGMLMLLFSLSMFAPFAQHIFERGFRAIDEVMRALM